MRLILASTSPQRRAILASLGVPFDAIAPHYDEVPLPGTAAQVVMERALGKALSVAGQTIERPILGVDTEVVTADGDVLGQPTDARAARAMLLGLAGREHRVISGLAVVGACQHVASSETIVRLRDLTTDEVDAYVAREEWVGRAGGYAIQETGAALIEEIRGDYLNVVGLPVALLSTLLAREGISLVHAGGISKTT